MSIRPIFCIIQLFRCHCQRIRGYFLSRDALVVKFWPI